MSSNKSSRAWVGVVAVLVSGGALAQAGISVGTGTLDGTIGTNTTVGGTAQCPAGTVLTGVRHVDKGTGGSGSTFGMTSQLDIFCSRVSTDGWSVTLTQTTPGSTPEVSGFAHLFPGTVTLAQCPAGQAVKEMGGYDRDTAGFPWLSQVQALCRELQLSSSDWVQFDTVGGGSLAAAGVLEANAPHTFRGYFCGTDANTGVSGYRRQAGGEGYDGINIYCSGFAQARFSAALTFSDFAWDKTLGGSGWRVDLRQHGAVLSDGGGNNGTGRTPHAGAVANIDEFQSGREIYIVPGSGYSATISQMPNNIDGDHFVLTGDCMGSGITAGNQQDRSCTLNVEGRPDLSVNVLAPASGYTGYGQAQDVVVSVENLGAGQVVAADGYRVVVTLPTDWSVAGALPAGCTSASSSIVTCALTTTLAAGPWPEEAGDAITFEIPVQANSPAGIGDYMVSAGLDMSVPYADADVGNDDYDDSNDFAEDVLVLEAATTLTLAKTWVDATPTHAVTVSVTGSPSPTGGLPLSAVANTPGETDTGDTPYGVTAGSSYTITEAFTTGMAAGYERSLACTGNTGAGASLAYTPNALSGVITVGSTATAITCTFTNRARRTDVSVIKTASAATVLSGQQIQFTLLVSNAGPMAADGAQIRDPATAGLNCSSITCTASGSASCPASPSVAGLQSGSGLTIPALPSGGSVSLGVTCTVTASGF